MNIIDSVYKYIQTGRSWYDREEKDIEKIVVHHSAIKMDKRLSDETLLDQIMRVHVGHDWPGLSYHYVICPNGNIHKCNEHTDITWHDTINSDSLAVLVCGYFHPDVNDEPTKEQLISLKELLDWLCTENPQFPADEDDVVGHRDRSATNCPGDILNKYVREYRENKGSVSWVDEEATSECEAKLSDMRDSRNKWRKDCKNTQKQLEVAIELSNEMEAKYHTEVSKYQNAIKAWEIDAKNLKTVTEDLVVLTQEIIDLKNKKYTVKQSLTFLKQAIKNILKRGESND